ncbi:hypothetical protein [Algoriphagus sp. PAP.12]|uniref:hypothetical protein n=1 Tax=Algoriphagus sp. PAP.12 TaxID=2996678 RepID=UPI00227AAA58|nr:hypothetical protein [Algoriphagus sp. PAP.12]
MSIHRRSFLEKIGLGLGVLALPEIGWSANLLANDNRSDYILHFGANTFQEEGVVKKIEKLGSPIVFTTNPTSSRTSTKVKLDGVLFTEILSKELKIDKNTPWVNTLIKDRPEFVNEYLIIKRMGQKIGVLGVDLESQQGTLEEILESLDAKAINLKKDFNCSQVFCLLNSQEGGDSGFNFKEVIAISGEIDFFFAESTYRKVNNLFAYSNKNGRQILLSINANKDENSSSIEIKESAIASFISD